MSRRKQKKIGTLEKLKNLVINMPKKKQILIGVVALIVLLSVIVITVSIANKNKDQVVEATEDEAIEQKDDINVEDDDTAIVDVLQEIKLISEDTVAYKRPKIKSRVVAELSCGDSVVVIKHKDNNWCEIEYNGSAMYVETKYLVDAKIEVEDEVVEEDVEEEVDENAPPQYSADGVYLIVNEEVRAEGDVWLHSEPGTNSQKIVVLDKGDTITRVGVGSNGWSQILYDGEIAYVATYWVAPTTAPKYDEVQEFVKLTESANLREESSINSRKIDTLPNGFEMVRIGVGRNGWSQVIYYGHVRYIYSAYITPIDREVTEADLMLND